jgi:hypothetical protein
MSEKNAYDSLKKVVSPLDRIDRVENVLVDGMPDVNYCTEGVECWIEIKNPKEPKRDTTPLFGSNHKLSAEQKNWMLRQMNAGGKAFILISTNKRWMLIDGKHADRVNEMTVSALRLIAVWYADKPVKEDKKWEMLRLALKANSKQNRTRTN